MLWLPQVALEKDFIVLCSGLLDWMAATDLKEYPYVRAVDLDWCGMSHGMSWKESVNRSGGAMSARSEASSGTVELQEYSKYDLGIIYAESRMSSGPNEAFGHTAR